MNSILERINSAGYAFVEFALPMLVQSGVLILLLLLVDLLLCKRVRAVFRYWIWMLVLLKLALPTSLSSPFSLGSWLGDELASVEVAATIPQTEAEGFRTAPVNVPPAMAPVNTEVVEIDTERIEPASAVMPDAATKMAEPSDTPAVPPIPPPPLSWQAIVFLIWLAVVVAMGLLLLQRALFVRGLVMQAGQADGPMADAFVSCRKLMAIRRKVGLKVSANAISPAVCGLFRPVILVPQNLEQGLGTSQLQAVLLHELAHIRRGDLWVNMAQTLLQIFYVYNPLLWLANAIIRRIREQAVDEMVLVAMGQKAQQYPQTLVQVAKMAFNRPAPGLRLIGVVESKSALSGRIKHILNRPIPKTARLGVLSLTFIAVAAAVLLPMAKSEWVDNDMLIKFSDCRPGPVKTVGPGDKATWSTSYDVAFREGEEMLVVAELYQAGKPMRMLGRKIFEGSTDPNRLSVHLTRSYGNEARSILVHSAKVQLGDQILDIPEFTVEADRFHYGEGWGCYGGQGLRKNRHQRTGQEYAKLENLFYWFNGSGGDPKEGQVYFWIPGRRINQTPSHHHIRFKMAPLSQSKDLTGYATAGRQGLDGKPIPEYLSDEQAVAMAEQYFMKLTMPLPELTAHKYYKAGEPVHIRVACKGLGWKPTLNEIDYDGNVKPIFVLIDSREYDCDPVFGPFSGISMNLQLPHTEGSSLPPGRHTVAYGWRDLDVVDPEKPGRVVQYDKLVTDVVEFEVVEEMPDRYYREVYEDGWEEILRSGIQTPFTDNMREYGVSGPLLALIIDSLPFDIAFEIYAQAEGGEEREYAGRVARQANSAGHYIMGCDREVEQLNWDTVGQKRWRLILVPSEKVAAANPPVHYYYGREFVTDWAAFQRSERFEQNRERYIAREQRREMQGSGGTINTGEPVVLRVAVEGGAMYRSIQEAINAAGAGAVIRIAPGVYREHLKINKPLTLEGTGWDKTTIMTRSAGADVFEEAMRKLSVRMAEATSDEQRKAIRNQFEAEFKEKYGSPTLLVSDTEDVVVRGLKLTSPGRRLEGRSMSIPIVRFSKAGAELAECAVLGTPGDGIHVLDGSDVEIRDCLVAAVWSTGIAVGGSRAKILNCDIRNCHHRCVTIGRGGDSTVVRNCRISGSAWHGIRYDNCSPTIFGNLIFGNARSGIYASGKTSATVMQNLFYANEMVGISCWFQNEDIIEGNTFADNKRSGLEILGASKPFVRKNIFFANPTGVSCGDISSDSPVARSDGVVALEQNLFWKNENATRNTSPKPGADNIMVDPLFVSADKKDFSLKAVSPARQSGIGATEPISFESPWPIQPEESAIIPEGQTRDSRKWKKPAQITSSAKNSAVLEKSEAAPVNPSDIALLYHSDSDVRIKTIKMLAASNDSGLIDDLIRAHSVENYTPVHNEYGKVLQSLTGNRNVRGKGAWKAWLAGEAQAGRLKIEYLPIKPAPDLQGEIAPFALKGPDNFNEMAATLTATDYDRQKCHDALRCMVLNDHLPEVQKFLSGDWLSKLFAHQKIDINHIGYVLNGLANPGPLRERVNAQVRSCLDSDNPIVVANALNLIAGVKGYSTRFTVPGVERKVEALLSSSVPEVAVQAQRAIERIRPVEKTVQETAVIEVKDGLHIKAFIDGRDTIKIKGVELWYEHLAWDLPGKWWDRGGNIKHDEPTYINGTAWKPEWMERISRPYRLKQAVPLRETSNLIKLTKIAGRGSVSIAGQPQQANDYTLSILLDDNRYNGAQWYEFLIQWGPRDSLSSQKHVSSPTSARAPVSAAKNDLQRMIDAAQPGGIVVIPKGVYTEPVVVAKPLTLNGQSIKDCIFEVTANKPAVFVDTKGKGEVIIEAVTIKWQLATGDRAEYPFALAVNDTKAVIKNCRFLSPDNTKRSPVAINSFGNSELTVDTCRFEGFEFTVCFGQGTKGTIRNSLVIGSGHQGISLYSGATAEIVGNVVTGSKYHAVRSTGGTLNMTGNLIINNANRGVYLGNKSARGTITNNVIIGNGTGISGFAQSNVKIENNVIADSSYAGIGMRDSCSLSIRDNIFKGNERGWIMFKELGRNNNAVYRNTFWRNKVDTENMDKTTDSIVADPAFANPDNGDFTLKPGPALERRQGLKNPEVFKSLWKRWKNRTSENEPFTGADA